MALDLDVLVVDFQRGPAAGHLVARRIGRVALHAHPIGPVAVAVGEAPGDLAVGAGNDRRRAGQTDAVDVALAVRRAGVGIAQAGAKPDIGHAQAQMHVVGQHGCAMAGEVAGHGEVVAAGARRVQCRRQRRGEAGAARAGRRLAQVEHLRAGHHRRARQPPAQRRLPVGVGCEQEIHQRSRQRVAHLRDAQLAFVAAVAVEVQVHRRDHQQAVLRPPGLGPAAQQQVFPGAHAQVRQPCVDAGGIAAQHLLLCRRQLRPRRIGHRAQAVATVVEIHRQRGRPHQRGQLARAGPAHQVHLEETFLRVHVAHRPGDVGAIAAVEGGRAARVAGDRHRRVQRRHRTRAVQPGEAAGEQPPSGGQRHQHQHRQGQQDGAQQAPAACRHRGTDLVCARLTAAQKPQRYRHTA